MACADDIQFYLVFGVILYAPRMADPTIIATKNSIYHGGSKELIGRPTSKVIIVPKTSVGIVNVIILFRSSSIFIQLCIIVIQKRVYFITLFQIVLGKQHLQRC